MTAHIDELRDTYTWVTRHIYMKYATHLHELCDTYTRIAWSYTTHIDELRDTNTWVTRHIYMNYATHIHESRTVRIIWQRNSLKIWLRQRTATHCNTLQHAATYCNILQHTATLYNMYERVVWRPHHITTKLPEDRTTATRCNTLPNSSKHCNMHKWGMSHNYNVAPKLPGDMTTATHCNHCNTLQHTATHCNTLPDSAMCMHEACYVRIIRQRNSREIGLGLGVFARCCVTWLIHMCDMTHSYVWHDSFIYVTWPMHMSEQVLLDVSKWWCVTWLIPPVYMSVRVGTLLCDMAHSYVWHDSFICVTWLIHKCDMTHSYVWRVSFICVTWLIHMCDMTC